MPRSTRPLPSGRISWIVSTGSPSEGRPLNAIALPSGDQAGNKPPVYGWICRWRRVRTSTTRIASRPML
jgi:hypothetical protein